jgi:hypothetical protein
VDLPDPDGPRIVTSSPSSTDSDSPSTAATCPYRFETLSSSKNARAAPP